MTDQARMDVKALSLQEMDAITQRAQAIRAAKDVLDKARERLALLNRHTIERKDWAVDQSWKHSLLLKKGDAYGYGKVTFEVELPFAIVQQQVVDAVRAAERAFILAGGSYDH